MTSSKTDDRSRQIRNIVFAAFVGAWLVNLLLHLPSFYRTSFPGDEAACLALSRALHWDLSHYTVMDHPAYARPADSIYAQPLFAHGPALPFVLKIGGMLHAPIQTAMFFQCVVMSLFFLHLRELQLRLDVAPAWRPVAYIGAAVCPFVLFSTTRLHCDAAAGLLIGCGLVALVEGLERRSVCWTIWSGLLFSLALNMRFTSILALPLVAVFHVYAVRRPAAGAVSRWRDKKWFHFVVLWSILLTIGLVHFYRLLLTYGTIGLAHISYSDFTDSQVQLLAQPSRWRAIINLLLTMPALLIVLIPETYRALYRGSVARSWGPAFVAASLAVLSILLFTSYGELRHFAFATPLFFLGLPWLINNAQPLYARAYVALCILSLIPMTFDAYRETMLRINDTIKADSPLIGVLRFLGV